MSVKRSAVRIGDLLIKEGVITSDQLEQALAAQNRSENEPLCAALSRLNILSEEKSLPILARQLGMEIISVDQQKISADLLKLVPARIATRYHILPVSREGQSLRVATADPLNIKVFDELQMLTHCTILPVLVLGQQLTEAIRHYYGVGADMVESMVDDGELAKAAELREAAEDLDKIGGEASTVKFVNQLLLEAVRDRATDVHLEPYEKRLLIRYRIDGILYEVPVSADMKRFHSGIVSRVKVMCNLNVAEHRLPQDGRTKVKVGGRDLDLRVSILPAAFGESVMIRLLSTNVVLGLEQIGLLPDHLALLEKMVVKPHGIVFVSGPTGAGKTTTLYAALARMNDRKRKVITIEDPIEYLMPGITQIQVHPKIDFTFAAALRSVLRHDPDVVMLGEVRDFETAETAIRTALTGHLVFSTLHTNDAAGCMTRLLDMGIEPYLAASSLECAIAVRLVRLICPECRAKGCPQCRQTGYKGRTGIFEFLVLDEDIRALVLRRASAGEITKMACSKGMRTLREDGMEKVRRGLTTIEEVMRVTEMDAS